MKKSNKPKSYHFISHKSFISLLISTILFNMPQVTANETTYIGNENDLRIHNAIHNSKKIFFVGDSTNPTNQDSQVTIDFIATNSNTPYNFYGGLNISEQGSASGNTVIFKNGEIGNVIYGGFHQNDILNTTLDESASFRLLAENNKVILNADNTNKFNVSGGASYLWADHSKAYPNI